MKNKKIQGYIKRHPDGFGFLISDNQDDPDTYIPRHAMVGIMTNDRVVARIISKGGRTFGEIEKVTQRSSGKIVGQVHRLNAQMSVIYDKGCCWGGDLRIPISKLKNASDGDWVAARITRFPEKEGDPIEAEVVDRIGDLHDPLNDIKRVLNIYAVPHNFLPKTIESARKLEMSAADLRSRKNLAKLPFVTIDGINAKDFDDAIYAETTRTGFLLYVAIADVSHFVKPGTGLDDEAYDRGNSTYFPNYVAPMLPEKLSNELCSLKPREKRFVMVAEMVIDFTGELVKSTFYEAIIESQSRLTYGLAQEIIDGIQTSEQESVVSVVKLAADIAKVLMGRRMRMGSLDLEIPETIVLVSESDEPQDIIRTERLFSHRVIEELMLIANVSVARFLSDPKNPALYRVHEPPFADSIMLLERFLFNFGSKKKLKGKLQTRLTKALQDFSNKPEGHILNMLALRSMNQAKYSANNIGHFGLGFSHYTHFTSPIRRYADLIVHRLLKAKLGIKGYSFLGENELVSAGTNLSACEQRSVKAERQWQAIKKARFMTPFCGQEFDGMIYSVTRFGFFVQLRQFDVDGLVKLESLKGRFEFDEEQMRLLNTKSGKAFELGDPVRIQIVQTNIELGQIDFLLVASN